MLLLRSQTLAMNSVVVEGYVSHSERSSPPQHRRHSHGSFFPTLQIFNGCMLTIAPPYQCTFSCNVHQSTSSGNALMKRDQLFYSLFDGCVLPN
mmetsp:Transcript_40366/g.74727  ORF Transcript_40366/g.74727 Transcript_40366/m.74727 type:complete len:94 (+) Transcript_40366:173-454(+)